LEANGQEDQLQEPQQEEAEAEGQQEQVPPELKNEVIIYVDKAAPPCGELPKPFLGRNGLDQEGGQEDAKKDLTHSFIDVGLARLQRQGHPPRGSSGEGDKKGIHLGEVKTYPTLAAAGVLDLSKSQDSQCSPPGQEDGEHACDDLWHQGGQVDLDEIYNAAAARKEIMRQKMRLLADRQAARQRIHQQAPLSSQEPKPNVKQKSKQRIRLGTVSFTTGRPKEDSSAQPRTLGRDPATAAASSPSLSPESKRLGSLMDQGSFKPPETEGNNDVCSELGAPPGSLL
jgi:hypothetical protein